MSRDVYSVAATCVNCDDKTQTVEIPFSEPATNENIKDNQCEVCGLYALQTTKDYRKN